ncbi:hypothetical protein, partial [Dactylosporangium salmoneum]|uniref:hypothetical protein n=1 Tax=Dactylosporangium salmoneum TaxID=53361 RepID=UPI0031DBBC6D
SSPAPGASALGAEPTEPAERARARLTEGIAAAIQTGLPNARLDAPLKVERVDGPSLSYRTTQGLTVGGRRATLSVHVMRRSAASTCTPTSVPPTPGDPAGAGPHTSCDTQEGPGGERIVTRLTTGEAQGGVTIVVYVDRSNGETVTVTVGVEFLGAEPKIERTQVTAIALDYRVTLYP